MLKVESPLLYVPDTTYHFDEHKALSRASMPSEVGVVLEREDAAYEADKAAYLQGLLDSVKEPVTPGGPKYAVIEEPDSSKDTAMVFTLPFCNPLQPDYTSGGAAAYALKVGNKKGFDSNTVNNLIKHGLVFDVLKALGVRDREGKAIPVVIISADSVDYAPSLDRKQKKALRKDGDLSVYADNAEAILEYEGFGKVHVGGYSQGASVGHAMLARSKNLDVVSATLAEMTSYKDRGRGELAKNYLLDKPAPPNNSGIKSDGKWTESGPKSRRELEEINNRAMVTMAQTIVAKGAWRTALALRHGTMQPDLIKAVKLRGVFPLALGWNGTSSITYDIEDKLIRTRPNEALDPFRHAKMLRLAKAIGHEAAGAPHLAGESPLYYALLMGQSVAWATQRG